MSLGDGREMIACELAHLAGEERRPVWEQDLRLGEAARIEKELAWRRVRGVVLVAEPELEVTQRDPCRLAAPPGLDQLIGERQERLEPLARLRRALGLEARCEAQPRDLDFDVYARVPIAGDGAVCLRVAMLNT